MDREVWPQFGRGIGVADEIVDRAREVGMRLHSLAVFAIALALGALFSQAPEFMQQYYQRIGGAVDELQRMTDQFNENARRLGHDRDSALGIMSSDPKPLIQGLARIENENAERLARLKRQRADLANASAIDRFLYLARNYDPALASATWNAFEPAVPLTLAGFGFAFCGFVVSLLLLSGLTFAMRRMSVATA
jgi:hypothetical protein